MSQQRLVILLLGLLWAPIAAGQSYLIHIYTSDDGLPSSAVFDLVQAPDGLLWAATRSGVSCYDGRSWRDLQSPVGGITRLAVDSRGTLWAIGHIGDHLLWAFDGERWEGAGRPSRHGEHTYTIIACAVVEHDDQAPHVAVGTNTEGIFLWDGSRWTHLDAGSGLPSNTVRGLAVQAQTLWVATDSGLCTVRDAPSGARINSAPDRDLPTERHNILAMHVEPDPSRPDSTLVWLVTTRGLSRLQHGSHVALDSVRRMPYRRWSIVHDGNGGLYFGDTHSLVLMEHDTAEVRHLTREQGLAANGVGVFLVDHESNVWVGGMRGLSKIVSRRFRTYRRSHGLLDDEVTAVAEPRPGVIVLGHPRGVSLIDGPMITTLEFEVIEGRDEGFRRVQDLDVDPAGSTWIAASDTGLGRLDAGGAIRWYGPRHGLALPVRAVLALADDRLLVSSGSNVYSFDGQRFESMGWQSPDTDPLSVRRFFQAADGRLLMATVHHGVVEARGDRIAFGPKPLLLGNANTYTVIEDRQGTVWAGTQVGLLQVIGGQLHAPDAPELRSLGPVYLLAEDERGDLWIGGDSGVSRWDGQELRTFTPRDGLAGRETNRAAGLFDSQGVLWVGTDGGVSAYSRDLDRSPITPPLLQLIGITAGGEELPVNGPPARVSHDHSTLVFSFRAISFVDERRTRYRFHLEGFEDPWSRTGEAHDHEARYTSLPPGEYRFHVQAANALGTWSSPVASPPITVSRPTWTRPWFVAAGAILVALAIYLVTAAVFRRRFALRLEQEVARRMADLRESEARDGQRSGGIQ